MYRLLARFSVIAGFVAGLGMSPAMAGMGSALYASGGDIQIQFDGQVAGFDSVISVNGGTEFLPNHGTPIGTTFDLGDFAAGTLLDIVLHVLPTDQYFHTGAGSGNVDGLVHAMVSFNLAGGPGAYVGFEDTLGGGDFDYDDHMFSLTNVQGQALALQVAQVPEPASVALVGLGLIGLAAARRRKLS